MHDPYTVLGLTRTATSQQVRAVTSTATLHRMNRCMSGPVFIWQVKQAYKKLALRWHPDLLPVHERQQAEATFKDISAAYAKITQGANLGYCNQCAASNISVSYGVQEGG